MSLTDIRPLKLGSKVKIRRPEYSECSAVIVGVYNLGQQFHPDRDIVCPIYQYKIALQHLNFPSVEYVSLDDNDVEIL